MEVPLKLRRTRKVIVEVPEEVSQVLHWRPLTHRRLNRNPRHGKFLIVCIIFLTPRYGLNNSLSGLPPAISDAIKNCARVIWSVGQSNSILTVLIETPVFFI